MKNILIICILISGFVFLSCRDESCSSVLPIEAKVIGLNGDCGLYELKITQGLEKVRSIVGSSVIDSIYISDNLPDSLKTPGVVIKLDIRKPLIGEIKACTTLGPGFTWIYITKAIKK